MVSSIKFKLDCNYREPLPTKYEPRHLFVVLN